MRCLSRFTTNIVCYRTFRRLGRCAGWAATTYFRRSIRRFVGFPRSRRTTSSGVRFTTPTPLHDKIPRSSRRRGRADGTVQRPTDSTRVRRRTRRPRLFVHSSIIPFKEADRWNLHMPGLRSARSAPRSLKQLRRQERDRSARRLGQRIRAKLATFPHL
jgi:hypothetical protein